MDIIFHSNQHRLSITQICGAKGLLDESTMEVMLEVNRDFYLIVKPAIDLYEVCWI
jgi:hypothetical protein